MELSAGSASGSYILTWLKAVPFNNSTTFDLKASSRPNSSRALQTFAVKGVMRCDSSSNYMSNLNYANGENHSASIRPQLLPWTWLLYK